MVFADFARIGDHGCSRLNVDLGVITPFCCFTAIFAGGMGFAKVCVIAELWRCADNPASR